MNFPLRTALIGVGGIGHTHLAAIETLAREGKVELTAVADPATGNLAEIRSALEARGVRWYAGYEDLLREEEGLDLVTIAAPIPFHFEMASACLRRNLFVNLEKPPVPLLQQLETLIQHDAKTRVSVGFQMIVSEPVQRLKSIVVEGGLGEILEIRAGGCWPRKHAYYARASWAGRLNLRGEPVFDGPATNGMAHVVHNIMYLASREPDGFETPVSVTGELYRARPMQSYDVACLRGELRSGAVFSGALTHATERELPFRLEVRGSKGWAKLSANGTHLETSRGDLVTTPSSAGGIEHCHRRFAEYITGTRDRVDSSLRDVRGYVAATNGMLLSSGGVHEIGPSWATSYGAGDTGGFSITGLHEAIEDFFESGKLFSETALPWAVRTHPVQIDHLDLDRCAKLLNTPEPV